MLSLCCGSGMEALTLQGSMLALSCSYKARGKDLNPL